MNMSVVNDIQTELSLENPRQEIDRLNYKIKWESPIGQDRVDKVGTLGEQMACAKKAIARPSESNVLH